MRAVLDILDGEHQLYHQKSLLKNF